MSHPQNDAGCTVPEQLVSLAAERSGEPAKRPTRNVGLGHCARGIEKDRGIHGRARDALTRSTSSIPGATPVLPIESSPSRASRNDLRRVGVRVREACLERIDPVADPFRRNFQS